MPSVKPRPLAQGGWVEQTGVATSRDLKTWTSCEKNLADGKRWLFFYYGLGQSKARDLLAVGETPLTPR